MGGSSSHGGERKWQGTSHDTSVSGDHMWVGLGVRGTRGGALIVTISSQFRLLPLNSRSK